MKAILIVLGLVCFSSIASADFSGRYSGTLKLGLHYESMVAPPARSTTLTFRVAQVGSRIFANLTNYRYVLKKMSRNSFGARGATINYPSDPGCAGVFDLVFSNVNKNSARIFYREVTSCTDGRFLHRDYAGSLRRR